MPLSLKQHVSSKYLEASHKLGSYRTKKRIVAYVESYDDIAFWRNILTEFENDEYYFEVMLPCRNSLTKGKHTVLTNTLNTEGFGKSLIACIDSDYDYLMQDTTSLSKTINTSPYIFQTYSYAIENFWCIAEGLHDVCVTSTLNDHQIFDFPKFLHTYSKIIYPLFLWHIWFYRQNDTHTFTMMDFNNFIQVRGFNIHNVNASYEKVRRMVEVKLRQLEERYPELIPQVKALGKDLYELGVEPSNTYLYIQGHHLMDNVVMRLLKPICAILRQEREAEIKRLSEHEKQYQNELSGYQNSQANILLALKKFSNFGNFFLYERIKDDVLLFMKNLKQTI